MSTTRRGPGYRHATIPCHSAWRRGCRCDACCAAHTAHLTAMRESGAHRGTRTHVVPLCPVHDADVYDRCLCGGA